MNEKTPTALPETQRFVQIVSELRRKCPWDRKQTHRSLIRYLLEEAYETVEAIESGKTDSLREELGDLLLQVILHAEIASQSQRFTIEDVARGIAEKMIRRHPHVFGDAKVGDRKQHARTWTQLKKAEKPDRGLLDGTPRGLPGLQLGQRYGEIAASVGFDWPDIDGVWDKVGEELGELKKEMRRRKRDKKRLADELGDVLFSLAQLSRHLGLDADAVARASARKFGDRFRDIEKEWRKAGKSTTEATAEEWDHAWRQAKKRRK